MFNCYEPSNVKKIIIKLGIYAEFQRIFAKKVNFVAAEVKQFLLNAIILADDKICHTDFKLVGFFFQTEELSFLHYRELQRQKGINLRAQEKYWTYNLLEPFIHSSNIM